MQKFAAALLMIGGGLVVHFTLWMVLDYDRPKVVSELFRFVRSVAQAGTHVYRGGRYLLDVNFITWIMDNTIMDCL